MRETDVVTNVDVWDGSVATALAGGSGTKDDPYQIATGAQLAYLAQEINDRIPDSLVEASILSLLKISI
ncbi:MAG: hypothetical protein ACLTZT_11210 [Butyricimonas faecalis]